VRPRPGARPRRRQAPAPLGGAQGLSSADGP
jgi:hypothetical protein